MKSSLSHSRIMRLAREFYAEQLRKLNGSGSAVAVREESWAHASWTLKSRVTVSQIFSSSRYGPVFTREFETWSKALDWLESREILLRRFGAL